MFGERVIIFLSADLSVIEEPLISPISIVLALTTNEATLPPASTFNVTPATDTFVTSVN